MIMLTLSIVNINADEYLRGLGFTAGRLSGVGITYRQYFEKNGLQFTFGMISNRDKDPSFPEEAKWSWNNNGEVTKTGWQLDGSMGAMFIRTIRDSNKSRFYYFVGGSVEIEYRNKYTQTYEDGFIVGSAVKKRHKKYDYYFGPGIGVDFRINKYISLLVELPMSISTDKKIESYIPQGAIIIRF